MINRFSNLLCDFLIELDMISYEDKHIFVYAFFLIISSVFFFSLTIFFGLIFNCIINCIVFYISFRAIRHFAGGYHADTEMRCEILTTLSFLAATYFISLSEKTVVQIIALVGAFLSTIVIAAFAPLDTPAKPLDEDEKRKYRRISLIILSIIVSVIIVSILFKIQLLLVPCSLSLLLEAILLTAGKIKGHLVTTG